MSSVELSIIMPCYNAEETLAEAINSIYDQNCQFSFEIILVVDIASEDNTIEIAKQFQAKKTNITIIFDDKHAGAAFARNLGFKNAKGNIVCSQDHDNYYDTNCLNNVITYFKDHKPNIAHISYDLRFQKNKIKHKRRNYKSIPTFEYLLSNVGQWHIYHFFFKKEIFNTLGGYPVNHHLDHHAMLFKVLSYGYTFDIIPETGIYFRFFSKDYLSYYEREYYSGKVFLSSFLNIEPYLHLFSDEFVNFFIDYNIFQAKYGFLNEISNLIKENFPVFSKNLKQYCIPSGEIKAYKDIGDETTLISLYKTATFYFYQKDYEKALVYYKKIIKNGFNSPIISFNILRSFYCLNDKLPEIKSSDKALEMIRIIGTRQNIPSLRPSFIQKIKEKLHF